MLLRSAVIERFSKIFCQNALRKAETEIRANLDPAVEPGKADAAFAASNMRALSMKPRARPTLSSRLFRRRWNRRGAQAWIEPSDGPFELVDLVGLDTRVRARHPPAHIFRRKKGSPLSAAGAISESRTAGALVGTGSVRVSGIAKLDFFHSST
jgi:hypothetical protein